MSDALDRLLSEPPERPRLRIRPADWDLLMGWATATDSETSGMGLLEADGVDLHVTRLFLLPQAGNEVETELNPAALARLIVELVAAGIDSADLRLWWHSHARETPFWSGLDEHTIASFAPVPMVSLVVDHRARHLARLDRFAPRATHWVTLHADAPGEPELAGPTGDPRLEVGADVRRVVRRLDGHAGLRAGGGP